eukprot:Blabericola_migrator_1__6895@NODE_3491_length_1731_cov_58_007212_g2170_i0_p1_GENE_NODE_3491_length_1731_cov_58_007212_g2170_i0NODE_3491_length_1731_cov_58_007212_g2170_i0_p1_ORF_typecomplete_len494_score74_48NiFe_hyd_3_EhaA/PF17367_2/7_7e03NiFe_hyd_3_EhaA/PF17367_2/0_0094NiFe_hyd_3_EhaA/PF17367_2/2_8e03_NODE_3491_length_1731_cov_58_007212_g2170_i01551636
MVEFFTQQLDELIIIGLATLSFVEHIELSKTWLTCVALISAISPFDLLLGLTAATFKLEIRHLYRLWAAWCLARAAKYRRAYGCGFVDVILVTSGGLCLGLGFSLKVFVLSLELAFAVRLFDFEERPRQERFEKSALVTAPFIGLLLLTDSIDTTNGYQMCIHFAFHIFTLGAVLSRYIYLKTAPKSRSRLVLFTLVWVGIVCSSLAFVCWRKVDVTALLHTRSSLADTPTQTRLVFFVLNELWDHAAVLIYWVVTAPLALSLGIKFALRRPPMGGAAAKHQYTLSRKYFHLMVLLVALPTLVSVKIEFAAAVWTVVLGFYTFIESLRASEVTALDEWLQRNVFPYADDRDKTGLIITPLMLILGTCCTILLEAVQYSVDSPHTPHTLRASLGMASACVGDAVAAVVGTWVSHPRPLPYSTNGKTMEGSAAFFMSFLLTLWCVTGGCVSWVPCVSAGLAATLYEGYTTGIDNFPVALTAYVTYHLTDVLTKVD